MKIYCENFNGVLDGVISKLKESGQLTDNYHFADAFLLWQDVRGACAQLAHIAKTQLKKPVIVMQHGRGATRDYDKPNNLKPQADRYLLWGESEAERMRRLGYGHLIEVVGCPLFKQLKPKAKERQGKNLLFAPVIAEWEQPENIMVYASLKIWESKRLIESLHEKSGKMKQGWSTEEVQLKPVRKPDGTVENKVWSRTVVPRIPRNVTYEKGLLNVKLTGVHDQFQYMSPVAISGQNAENHVSGTIDLLRNTDVLICLEEGTMQLLACALDIPIVFVDIFNYGSYGGIKDYDQVEKISTKAVYRTTNIEKVGDLVDHALKFPEELRKQRILVCEREAGAHLGDPIANAIRAIENTVNEYGLVKA